MMTLLGGAAGWLLIAALTGVLGVLVGRWLLVRALPGPHPARDLERGLRRAGLFLGALLIAAFLAVLARQLAEFRDPFAPLAEDLALLVGGTAWGDAWILGLVGTILVLVGFALAGRGRTGWYLATIAALSLVVFPARTGHANAVESFRWLALTADAIHVLGAGLWLGGLGVLLMLVRAVRRTEERAEQGEHAGASVVPRLVHAFSPVAQLGVASIVTTGVVASWLQLPSVAALFTSGYGRTLLLKLALVAAALLLGWLNWKKVTPRLGGEEGREALVRLGTREFLVLQVVLIVTAFLVRTSPA